MKNEPDDYKGKRDFNKTSEPEGKSPGRQRSYPLFVIQQHHATAMHYDFRLEIDGVLKSWAIPKGPSINPSDKRLAMETEDHPMEYADFEGVITEGNYGAGAMIVWDKGVYKNIKQDESGQPLSMEESYKKGTIEIWMVGDKVKGGFALIRFKGKNQWLLIKMKDENAGDENITKTRPESVKSRKTIYELGGKK